MTPCENDYYNKYRRCLGQKPSQCVYSSDWGSPYFATCDDNSDKVMNSTTSLDKPCNGSNYFWHGDSIEMPIGWGWFHCKITQKCIHIDSRCDLHPSPHCIYEKNGVMVAEDEEDCFDEYKKKGLVAKTANVICSSQDHNIMSPAVISTILNSFDQNGPHYTVSVPS